ncbi:cation transporter [Magnetospirillum sp. UT-4]|uniref:cation transporter n=1 Tax=Magnetospirillum sp. UT-4 TaxID=2681467 RepID=UPI00137DB82F|nr:cation transporter [Magnetospirillum sp. UT-4]CAA7618560.1 putative membrane protein [Magnetospirillum sp. UT-4]
MSATCGGGGCGCGGPPTASVDPLYRRILIFALVVNAIMFAVEFGGGVVGRSASLLADSGDFLSDAANYAISLAVLGLSARRRAQAALFKGLSLGAVGLWVAGSAAWHLANGTLPKAEVMGAIGLLAFAVNAGVALLLYRYRAGDANMRSIWLCSRNDAIGNLAVLAAAAGVWASDTPWPDLMVAVVLAWLPLSAAVTIVRQAAGELAQAA